MTKVKKALITAAGILFWLIIWQIIAVRLNSKILLVSPVDLRLSACAGGGESKGREDTVFAAYQRYEVDTRRVVHDTGADMDRV